MNIQDQKKAVGDSYAVAAAALRGFQASQGLPIDSVDEISLMRSGADDCQLEVLNAFANLFDTLQRFQEELTEHDPLKELDDEVREVMTAAGFEYWQTGGGCTAWGKRIMGSGKKDAPYVMVTMQEDSAYFSSPLDALDDKAVLLCFYAASGDWLNDEEPQYFTWKQFKEMCEG